MNLVTRGLGNTNRLVTAGLGNFGGSVVPPDSGASGGFLPGRPLSQAERERIERAMRALKADTRRQIEREVFRPEIDAALLERAILAAQARALAGLPEREPNGRKQRAPLVEIDVETILRRDVFDDMNLRLLLLLGC